MKISTAVIAVFIFCLQGTAQKNAGVPRPRLVVGIVIDQMRWDYLYRYSKRYSDYGFKKLLTEGYSCENTFIPYLPTYTAPGHTCIYTGSVPAIHGIVSNNWYNRWLNKTIYCTEDTVHTVGSTSDAGQMSPANMWTNTITDELRLATNLRSKVVGIALKDRGAILPAGHSANAAYWFDNSNGSFITSTYYMKELPAWVQNFNNKKLPDQYLLQNWNTLYPINTYTESTADDEPYESILPGEDNTFPHNTAAITKDKYNVLRYTPYGNTLTIEMAKAAIEGEAMGQAGTTDFLAVSFSSTDYVGHAFGPNSIETEDIYLRLDNDLALFFSYLDKKIGKGQYTVFLSADHGAAHVPAYAKEQQIPAGAFNEGAIKAALNEAAEKSLKIKNAIQEVSNYQVYFAANINGADLDVLKDVVIKRLMEYPYIANAVDLKNINAAGVTDVQKVMLTNGYNQKLSGDVQFMARPQWVEGNSKGTTHGAWNPYDAHIPLLWCGWGISKGSTNRQTYMTDIAATLAALLHIQMPNGCIGKVIEEVIKH